MLIIGFIIFIGTEAIARLFLFNKELKHVAQRLHNSHEQFAAIKDNIVQIKDNLSDVAKYVVKGEQNSKEPSSKSDKNDTKNS